MDWKSAAALMTLTFFGMGSLVYFLLKHDSDEADFFVLNSGKTSVLEVKIPIESVGLIIGRGGNTIKDIESKCDVKIQIKDESDGDAATEYRICIIKGTPEATQYAQSMIHELIVSQPLILTFEMSVPDEACGRIIGKNGDNIRLISRSSNAKIVIVPCPDAPLERKIIIKGTSEQIGIAESLIEQKVAEYFEFKKKVETQVSNRSHRNKPKYLLPAKGETEEENSLPRKQKFVATGSNGLLEVYVSAMESPDRFWLQMMGPSTVELDKLVEQMTTYYSDEKNRAAHKLKEIKCGQIVAAPFTYDDKWYRAEIQEIGEASELEESNLLLYYVDYGDSSKCKRSCVHELRTDFLRLRFQAIECSLAKVKPRDSLWSEEATDLMEDLTHVALWKPVMAKIHTYRDRPRGTKREGSPIPCVELYDLHGDKTIDVASELVQRGFATWEKENEPGPTSRPQDVSSAK